MLTPASTRAHALAPRPTAIGTLGRCVLAETPAEAVLAEATRLACRADMAAAANELVRVTEEAGYKPGEVLVDSYRLLVIEKAHHGDEVVQLLLAALRIAVPG